MPEGGSSGGAPRTLSTRLARGFLDCGSAAAAYGTCIRNQLEGNLAHKACQQSFEELKRCVQKSLAKAKGGQ